VIRGRIIKQGSPILRWALVEAIQRTPAGTPIRQATDAVIARRGPQTHNIAKVAAARKLLTYVFYAMRDGHVRALATAAQPTRRLGVSRETIRRLAIAGALPHTVVCQGARKTTRRYPRRFAEEFAATGLEVADLAAFAAAWRARVTAPAR
jgi:hypothetical protein